VRAAVSKYDWLLFLHITGAFLLGGGSVAAAALNVAAQLRERPSEIALLLTLTRVAVVSIVVGALATLGFGLWLVSEAPFGYGYGQAWVLAAIVLWVLGTVMGSAGGRRDRETHELAARLAAEGDLPRPELKARLRAPLTLVLSYGAGLAIMAVLGLMIWKPGA
jgi:uncharacterized membrane protein